MTLLPRRFQTTQVHRRNRNSMVDNGTSEESLLKTRYIHPFARFLVHIFLFVNNSKLTATASHIVLLSIVFTASCNSFAVACLYFLSNFFIFLRILSAKVNRDIFTEFSIDRLFQTSNRHYAIRTCTYEAYDRRSVPSIRTIREAR